MVENLYQWMRERIWKFINWYIEREYIMNKLTFSFNFGSTCDEFADMVLSLIYRVKFNRPLSIYADWKFTRNKTLELYQNHHESSMERNRIRIENFWSFLHVLKQREAPLVHFTTVFDWSHTSIQYLSYLSTITHLSLLRLYAMETVNESTVTLLLDSMPGLISLSLDVSLDEEQTNHVADTVNTNGDSSDGNSVILKHKHHKLRVLDLGRCRSQFKYLLDMPELSHLMLSRMVGGKYRNSWDRLWSRCFEDNFLYLPSLQYISVDSKTIALIDITDGSSESGASSNSKRTDSLKYFCQCSRHARHAISVPESLRAPP